MRALYHILRRLTLLAQTNAQHVSLVGRLLRGCWMVWPFGLIVVLLRARYRLTGPLQITAHTRFGSSLTCALPDMIPLYIATFGTWEPDLTAIISQNLRKGDVFVDVGANIGYDTLLASQIVGSDGRVVAVEADPQIAESLAQNIAMNTHATNTRVVNCAISDEPGMLVLDRSFTHNRGRTRVRPKESASGEAIEARPLGDILTPAERTGVRMIKIDVEGAEPAVLRGLLAMLDECPENVMLLVELSPQWWGDPTLRPADLLEPFLRSGFKAYTIPNNYWPWRYMWPNSVSVPHPLNAASMSQRPRRIDLILSREDLS